MENITVIDVRNKTIVALCELMMINCTGIGIFTVNDLCKLDNINCIGVEDAFRKETPRMDNTRLNAVLMSIAAFLIILGVVGNSGTIVVVKFREKFHSATFTAIALLALVDLFAVCLRGLNVVDFFYYLQGLDKILSHKSLIGLITTTFTTFVCSCAHVVILARLRYKLLAFPIEALTITAKNIVYQSLLAWGVSCILGIPYGLSLYYMDLNQGIIVDIILGFAICLGTILPIVFFSCHENTESS